MTNLFAASQRDQTSGKPLAEVLRPKTWEEVMGQEHLLSADGILHRLVEGGEGTLASLIFWGPPGTGKTTTARLLAQKTDLFWVELSAVFAGVADLKKVFEAAKQRREMGQGTLLFIDEIHRFNRAQQDALLPVVEDGTVVLIGATTENPSFALNAPLLSRARVLIFNRLSDEALLMMLARAEQKLERELPLSQEARTTLITLADGDGRALLTLLDDLLRATAKNPAPLSAEELTKLLQRRAPLYDKAQEGHYNLISALHKAVRGSDPDAALYYFCRMVDGGEDPLFLARRLIRMASEDIGLASPEALSLCVAARDSYQMLGSPEGELALAQAVVYLATAPKSNAVYVAYKAAMQAAKQHGSVSPPATILNAPTKLMREIGYGADYIYDHDTPDAFSGQNYFPESFKSRPTFYDPAGRGYEHHVRQRLDRWAELRAAKNPPNIKAAKGQGA
jgi:putative ATPase